MSGQLQALPIDAVLSDITSALSASSAVVVLAPPGAGKTTRVPVALDRAGAGAGKLVVILQPRRVAARAAARRVAIENGWRLGEEVGYQVRFDACWGAATRVLFVTEGILLTMLQRDPFLEQVGVLIFDEFHERSLEGDLALAMARRVQHQVRPDLGLLVMSATLDGEPVARFLGCSTVVCSTLTHPVQTSYLKRPLHGDPALAAAAAVGRVLAAGRGDVLVFLPGVAAINRCALALAGLAERQSLAVMPLYGDLASEQQDRVLQPGPGRKVVVATNLAETSLTIPGVTAVVDSGLAKVLRHDPGCGLNRLETVRISRAAADQRVGRAGREQPGTCLRLWTEAEDRGLRVAEVPEIARLELSHPVLQLLAWGETELTAFPWFDPPPPAALARAHQLLDFLGAIDEHGLTAQGRVMAALPLPPRLARLLVAGAEAGDLSLPAMAAAMLSEGLPAQAETLDLTSRTIAAEGAGRPGVACSGRQRHLLRVRDQLLRIARDRLGAVSKDRSATASERLGRALIAAFPDRLARRRQPGSDRLLMVGGQGLRLDDRGELAGQNLLVAVVVTAGARRRHAEARIRQAVAVDPDWLPEQQLTVTVELEFDPDHQRVRAYRRQRWRDLILEQAECAPPDPEAVAKVLSSAAAGDLEGALALDDSRLESFLARLNSLAQWRPELAFPAFTASELAALLPLLCQGKRSFAELRQLPLVDILVGTLAPAQQRALAREAPESLAVPSGSRIRLVYEPGRPPVLAVRIQEIFGLTATPTVAGGRVPVLLHLLAPNRRPQQVTDDLASFWANTYPLVRAQLRGRYPKHHWPEDPLTATATRRGLKKPKLPNADIRPAKGLGKY